MSYEVGDKVSPEQDLIMEDGEVAYTAGKVYEIVDDCHPLADFNVPDDSGDEHGMDAADLVKHNFKIVSDGHNPRNTNDAYDHAMKGM